MKYEIRLDPAEERFSSNPRPSGRSSKMADPGLRFWRSTPPQIVKPAVEDRIISLTAPELSALRALLEIQGSKWDPIQR